MEKACLAVLLALCRVAAWPLAGLHALLLASRIVPAPPALANTPPRFASLRACWEAKAARELLPFVLASPLRAAAMERVHFAPPVPSGSGCVFATLRSPWLKLISACCREQRAGRVLVHGGRSRFWREAAIAADRAGLRAMIVDLRAGGYLFVAMDAFVHARASEASALPARLAASGGVPLVATVPVLRGTRIEFDYAVCADSCAVIAWLETRVAEEPAVWNETLRGWVGILRGSEAGREEPAVDPDRLAGHERGGG